MNRRTVLQSTAALGLWFTGKSASANNTESGPQQNAPNHEFVLASGGRSQCSIVVNHGSFASAEEASASSDAVDWFASDTASAAVCTESFAALELRHYLCAMAGLDPYDPTHFPIHSDRDETPGNVIIVGSERSNRQCVRFQTELAMNWAEPQPEGFRIKTVGAKNGFALLLAGYVRAGTLYAVYDFLNLCGVRWFSPTLNGEVVPSRSEFGIPAIDRSDAPKFHLRGYWAEFFVQQHPFALLEGRRGTTELFNWMARNRLNLWNAGERAVPPGELLKRGLRLTSFGVSIWSVLDPALPYPYRHARFSGNADKPPDPYSVSPDYRGDVNGDGILSYAEAHPEWYGLGPDGQRHFPTDPFGYNFCTSNGEMIAEFVKNVVEKLQGDLRGAEYVEWVPEDSRERWCVCENCRKLGTPTDRSLLMAYHLREGLKRARQEGRLTRDVKVHFIIYLASNVIDPPTRPLPPDFDYDGIAGTFFPIHRCYVHGLDDAACTEFNRPYVEKLDAWRRCAYYQGNLIMGEFYNVSALRDLPVLFTRTMERDIRYYYRCGVRAMHYMHVPVANWGPRAITNCQFARILWNPEVDIPEFIDDYLRHRYEDAHPHLRAFYASLEQTMLNVPEYVTTPASYNLPKGSGANSGHLQRELHLFADGKTTNLFPFRHLRMSGEHAPPDDGPSMQDTLRALAQCERLMDQVLSLKVSERVRACILEDAGLFRYAAATIRLYYHLARSTQYALKSPEWVREMKRAGLEADYLDSHPVGSVAVADGTAGLMRNALDCTAVRDVYARSKALLI